MDKSALRCGIAAIMILASLGLASCEAGSRRSILWTPEQWRAAVIERGIDAGSTPNPLDYTEEMMKEARLLAGVGTPLARLGTLQASLFDPHRFPFTYETGGTFTAVEAFKLRRGNCLSFTAMFISLGRSIGIPIQAATPMYTGSSQRSGDLVIVNSHVVAVYPRGDGLAVFDFDRARHQAPVAVIPLDDLQLTAMYLNNHAVEAMRAQEISRSVNLLERAVRLAPRSVVVLGNLGVARRRSGDLRGAAHAYGSALDIDPHDPAVLADLASLYRASGREDEARLAIEQIDVSRAPLHALLVRAGVHMLEGDAGSAVRLCDRARRLDPDDPEPWICRARAESLRGRTRAARRALDRAQQLNPSNPTARALREAVGDDGS